MKVSRKRLKAELQHPDHADLFITFQRADELDVEELGLLITKARELNGSMSDAVLKACATYILDIRGLEDEDTNQPIVYAGAPLAEKMSILRLFADAGRFSVTLPEPRMVKVKQADGTEKEIEQTKENFYSWVLRKGNDPETFGISSGKG